MASGVWGSVLQKLLYKVAVSTRKRDLEEILVISRSLSKKSGRSERNAKKLNDLALLGVPLALEMD